MTTIMKEKCVCGLAKEPTAGPGTGYYCPNCDAVQPQEAEAYPRHKTTEDIRYQMHWVREIDKTYTDNTLTGPEVSSANLDDEGDTESEDEGVQDE